MQKAAALAHQDSEQQQSTAGECKKKADAAEIRFLINSDISPVTFLDTNSQARAVARGVDCKLSVSLVCKLFHIFSSACVAASSSWSRSNLGMATRVGMLGVQMRCNELAQQKAAAERSLQKVTKELALVADDRDRIQAVCDSLKQEQKAQQKCMSQYTTKVQDTFLGCQCATLDIYSSVLQAATFAFIYIKMYCRVSRDCINMRSTSQDSTISRHEL